MDTAIGIIFSFVADCRLLGCNKYIISTSDVILDNQKIGNQRITKVDAAIELIGHGVTDTLGVVASSVVRRLFLVQEVVATTRCSARPGSADAASTSHSGAAVKPRARRRKRRGRPVDVQQVKAPPTSSCEPPPRCDMDILTPICALVASALYYNTIGAGFVYDDRWVIYKLYDRALILCLI